VIIISKPKAPWITVWSIRYWIRPKKLPSSRPGLSSAGLPVEDESPLLERSAGFLFLFASGASVAAR
jgi:hypothetical protein